MLVLGRGAMEAQLSLAQLMKVRFFPPQFLIAIAQR